MTAPEFSSASADAGAQNFAKFRQFPVFHARLLSEYQNQYSNHWCRGVGESPQAII
jgi:hypothetical protein